MSLQKAMWKFRIVLGQGGGGGKAEVVGVLGLFRVVLVLEVLILEMNTLGWRGGAEPGSERWSGLAVEFNGRGVEVIEVVLYDATENRLAVMS